MRLVCEQMKKNDLPEIAQQHDRYLLRNAPRFYPILDDMLERLRQQWSVADVQRSIDAKNPDFLKANVTSVLDGKQISYDADPDWTRSNRTGLSEVLKQLLNYDAAQEILLNLYSQMATDAGKRERTALGVTTSFRLENPDAISSIRLRTGDLITDVDATTRRSVVEMVRQSLLRNYNEGPNSASLAREIKKGIGMHPTHAKWWANHRQRLIKEGLTGRNLEVASKKYQEKLIRYRSKMIARTETSFAISRGQQASWSQAQTEGLLDADQKKEWVALLDNRTSDICLELHSQDPIPVGEDFVFTAGRGGACAGPPAHPFCRSVVMLVRSTEGFKR